MTVTSSGRLAGGEPGGGHARRTPGTWVGSGSRTRPQAGSRAQGGSAHRALEIPRAASCAASRTMAEGRKQPKGPSVGERVKKRGCPRTEGSCSAAEKCTITVCGSEGGPGGRGAQRRESGRGGPTDTEKVQCDCTDVLGSKRQN